jgi:hypothetical protein
MTAQKWVRSSLRTLSVKLEGRATQSVPPTVGRLLRKLDQSLHVNAKKTEASSAHPDREQQFDCIAAQRATFSVAGLPIIGVDTKKKRARGRLQERRPDLATGASLCEVRDAWRLRLPLRRLRLEPYISSSATDRQHQGRRPRPLGMTPRLPCPLPGLRL